MPAWSISILPIRYLSNIHVLNGKPDLVHGRQAFSDVVQNEIGVVHQFEVSGFILPYLCLKLSVVQSIQILFNSLLQGVGEWLNLALGLVDVSVYLDQELGELLQSAVQLMVPIEAGPQGTAAYQGEEGETATDRPRLPLLKSCQKLQRGGGGGGGISKIKQMRWKTSYPFLSDNKLTEL